MRERQRLAKTRFWSSKSNLPRILKTRKKKGVLNVELYFITLNSFVFVRESIALEKEMESFHKLNSTIKRLSSDEDSDEGSKLKKSVKSKFGVFALFCNPLCISSIPFMQVSTSSLFGGVACLDAMGGGAVEDEEGKGTSSLPAGLLLKKKNLEKCM